MLEDTFSFRNGVRAERHILIVLQLGIFVKNAVFFFARRTVDKRVKNKIVALYLFENS